MKYHTIADNVLNKLDSLIEGKNLGMTTGFKGIDENAGRLQKGQLWTIGGYTGTGKSYFVLNMIDGMLREKENLRIALFATEMSNQDYLVRYICMKLGIYKLELQKNPKNYIKDFVSVLTDFIDEREKNPNSLDIYGDIYSYEQIESVVKDNEYDVIFIDYIQELTISKKTKTEDTMPLLASKLKQLALDKRIAIIITSQINNYAMQKGYNMSSIPLQPFSFGKELIAATHTAIVLFREKKEDKLSPILEVKITKARDGATGSVLLHIGQGYKLRDASQLEIMQYQS